MFPHFQHIGSKSINITASAWNDCPNTFQPTAHMEFYLAFTSEDRAVQLLHKSLREFSQNKSNYAIIFLYAAMEAAATILSRTEDGKISTRFYKFANQIECFSPTSAKTMRRLKKQIEKRIIAKRGDFAHQGKDLVQQDLLHCYETALEFFWHYSELKALADKLQNKGSP